MNETVIAAVEAAQARLAEASDEAEAILGDPAASDKPRRLAEAWDVVTGHLDAALALLDGEAVDAGWTARWRRSRRCVAIWSR
jgi:anti-sigma factor ChrR (cupin superfamily)